MSEMAFAPQDAFASGRLLWPLSSDIAGRSYGLVIGYKWYNNINPSGIINRSEWDSNGVLRADK